MHLILIPGLFMLAVLAFTACAVWCCLCFRLGHWFVQSVCPAQRTRPVHSHWESSPRLRLEASPPANPALPRCDAGGAAGGGSRRHSGGGFTLILAVLVGCLLVFGFQARSSSSFSAPKPVESKPPAGLGVDQKPDWVTGRGATREDAKEDALLQACASVKTYLNDELHLRWNPSQVYFQKYVQTKLVKEMKYDGTREQPGLGTVHEVSVRFEVSPEQRMDLLKRDRLFLFAKLLGIAVALLTTGAIYIRLDEFSKGYYTAWLRLGAICAAAATCAGWWFGTFG